MSLLVKITDKRREHAVIKLHSVLVHFRLPKDLFGVKRSLAFIILFFGSISTLINAYAVTRLLVLKQLRVEVLHAHDFPPHVFGEISSVPERTLQPGLQLEQRNRRDVVLGQFCCLQQDNGLWLMATTTTC
ncbi:hypothetical protein TRVL_10300 [Trypanosoma vivax]|nr:hypothetical protein TRVL_10300 [Trypanosoma vivax]